MTRADNAGMEPREDDAELRAFVEFDPGQGAFEEYCGGPTVFLERNP